MQEKKDLDRRWAEDLRAFRETVDSADTEVRALFERPCRENRFEDRLIDTDQLFLLKEEDEALFQKAIGGYSGFIRD